MPVIVDRVTGSERFRIARCETFEEAAKVVDEDILLRQSDISGNSEGCMYEIKKEEEHENVDRNPLP